ncbi:hypothetical protein PUN28_009290 [Cardiocondyla obscurior]|uniref:ZAD domain-containing protein n=1 Tax=Cardiocondyla obscurior TaxID=286306 RepID=A0AAW2FT25_9HYME
MNKTGNNVNKDTSEEQLRCFVCDDEVQGRSYSLATCKTQNSRTRLVEKLAELVGERYMVVISEDDVICRSCGVLINNLDRAEMEMCTMRDTILNFLEHKYSLKEGELHSDQPKPCQFPQITKSRMKDTSVYFNQLNKNDSNQDDSKEMVSHSWLQCNKCKYTTHLNCFTTYHLKDYNKQKLFHDFCGQGSSKSLQVEGYDCNKADDLENKENQTDNSDVIAENDAVEITASNQTQPVLSIIQTTPLSPTNLLNCNDLYSSNALARDSASSRHSTYDQSSINTVDTDNSRKRLRSDSSDMQNLEEKNRSDAKKQLLTMKEDGSLQIVEITWEEETKTTNTDSTSILK